MAVSLAWRVPLHSRFHWRAWDDEHVVYHVNSGDTHRLNAVGARALRLLMSASLTSAELATHLEPELPGETDAVRLELVEALVSQLRSLGLVEPAA